MPPARLVETGRNACPTHRKRRLPGGPASVLAVLALLSGCAGDKSQSALRPAGPGAEAIESLWWLMFWVFAAVFVSVLVLLVGGLIRRRRRESPPGPPLSDKFVIAAGIVLPSIILIVLLLLSLGTTVALREPKETAFTVRVVGHQWWWEVHYPTQGITTANEIIIPVGAPVRVELESADVIHSFWVPSLAGKMDMVPGQTNTTWVQADAAGTYRGLCAEFCGTQHALMALSVVAVAPEEFERWTARRQGPPPEPAEPGLERGRQVFFDQACHTCHAIRGTSEGKAGPDLTHLGSRLTLGAGTVPNTTGWLSGWISNPQPIKPGNKMPANHMSPDDLHALVGYLRSLE